MIGRWDFFSFVPTLLLSILSPLFIPFSSVFFLFHSYPMRECLGKHSCMSFSFPMAILNGTCFFRQCNYKYTVGIQSEKPELVKHQITWTFKLNLLFVIKIQIFCVSEQSSSGYVHTSIFGCIYFRFWSTRMFVRHSVQDQVWDVPSQEERPLCPLKA